MNEPSHEKILRVLEPPPGGLARLRSRRDSQVRNTPSWWALAAGAATAAVVAMTVFSTPTTEIRLPMSGGRLIGARGEGASVTMLEGGRAVPLSSDAADVRIYWVEPAR